jgi:hypothetical protein
LGQDGTWYEHCFDPAWIVPKACDVSWRLARHWNFEPESCVSAIVPLAGHDLVEGSALNTTASQPHFSSKSVFCQGRPKP